MKTREHQKAAPFAQATLKAMETADPTNPTIKKVPYTGITFVGVPESQSLGTVVGQRRFWPGGGKDLHGGNAEE